MDAPVQLKTKSPTTPMALAASRVMTRHLKPNMRSESFEHWAAREIMLPCAPIQYIPVMARMPNYVFDCRNGRSIEVNEMSRRILQSLCRVV